jgi:hypothetical protein
VAVVHKKSIEAVKEGIDEIRSLADEVGFCVIRGAIPGELVQSPIDRINRVFDAARDVRISGDYERDWPDFHRLDLGEYGASTRFARYFFFFPWNGDPAFDEISRAQMEIYNLLARKEPCFGSMTEADSNPNRFRLSFVLQYPIGGGFMSRHREYTQQEEGDKAYVLYLALTTRGKDFESGGAYLCRNGDKIDIEEQVRAGDLLIYRGDLFHGVDGVDRHKPVALDQINGRLMLTTTIKYFADPPAAKVGASSQ